MVLYIKLYILLFFKLSIFCFENQANFSYINNQDFSIKNAVYIIRNRDGKFNLEFKYSITNFINNEKIDLKQNFEILEEINNTSEKEKYYYIKEKELDLVLSSDNDQIIFKKESLFIDKDLSLWKMIPKINEENQLVYYVQNKKNKNFWDLTISKNKNNFKLTQTTNVSNLNKSNEFQFIELYKEVEKKNSTLLDQEPIDVFIKYIDLTDKKLNRTGITQIKKDEDNEELRYSVRSILKNIPWIRKIFIVMPNEEVKYFKPKDEIQEKIVYLKDKDLVGFDTASIYVFQFNLYKLKQFGVSENFIIMDDDYFIASPLQKSDFFYEENGVILPALVATEYYEINLEKLKKKLQLNLSKKASSIPHSDIGFYICQIKALLLMYKIFGNDNIRFGKTLIEPAFTHNAIPVKMSDIQEIHDYALNNYEYGKIFLFSLIRTSYDLQMQTMYMAYVKNKYDRKVSKIPSAYYDLSSVTKLKSNKKKLFVINTSVTKYNVLHFEKEKQVLKELFPEITKYEIHPNYYTYINIKNNISNNFNKIENIKINISKEFNKIKTIINIQKNIYNNDTFFEDILKEETQIIKQLAKFQKNFIIFFLCLILLFMLNKTYNHLKQINKY